MKFENLIKKVISLSIVIIISLFCTTTVLAVDFDGDGYDDETGEYIGIATEAPYEEPVYTAPVYTDPIVETTQYVEPATEQPVATQAPYEEPETETPQVQTEQPTQAQYVDEPEEETTEFVAPTVAKTVSEKKYETNYTAGMISWICVGVGLLVVAFVVISTKVSGRKANRRRI